MAMLDRDHQQAGVEVPAPHRPIQRPPPGVRRRFMGRAVVVMPVSVKPEGVATMRARGRSRYRRWETFLYTPKAGPMGG